MAIRIKEADNTMTNQAAEEVRIQPAQPWREQWARVPGHWLLCRGPSEKKAEGLGRLCTMHLSFQNKPTRQLHVLLYTQLRVSRCQGWWWWWWYKVSENVHYHHWCHSMQTDAVAIAQSYSVRLACVVMVGSNPILGGGGGGDPTIF